MSAKKRYQVFVSSTFKDLVAERQAVLQGVLELDHMPAGMELFPASDDTAWRLIQDVIDASDYYIVILGGRYGSLGEEGIGFTEMEYDYAAASAGIPVIPLLHKDPDNLPRDKTETNDAAWAKLQEFRAKLEESHTCKYWESTNDLKAKVITGLSLSMKRTPRIGWIRANEVPSGADLEDVLALRQEVERLRQEAARSKTEPPPGTEDLEQGDDKFTLNFKFVAQDRFSRRRTGFSADINPTWNQIFGGVAPVLINEASEPELRMTFKRYFERLGRDRFEDEDDFQNSTLINFNFREDQIDTCLVQLRALGLIVESDRKRSVTDTSTYWALTPYGDFLMVQLRALRRSSEASKVEGAKVEDVGEAD